jgi:hypothetical protein
MNEAINLSVRHAKLDETFIGFPISQATMKEDDVANAMNKFVWAAEQHLHSEWVSRWNDAFAEWATDFEEGDSYSSTDLNETLWNLFEEIAPEGTYYGSSEGDGADFSFWKNENDY